MKFLVILKKKNISIITLKMGIFLFMYYSEKKTTIIWDFLYSHAHNSLSRF